jgi:hypothetical protein
LTLLTSISLFGWGRRVSLISANFMERSTKTYSQALTTSRSKTITMWAPSAGISTSWFQRQTSLADRTISLPFAISL